VKPEDYLATRPPEVEAEAVNRVVALARVAGSPLYVVHVSCAEALAPLTAARARGQQVYAETCPHYLTLTADEVLPRFGSRAKIAPPLRSRGNVDALRRAVADGRIDTIGSDHCAFPPRMKEPASEVVFDAAHGAPGVETMLPVLFDAAVSGGWLALERLVSVLAETPARIFGLEQKGRVAPGADADLVILDPRTRRTISIDGLHGGAYYTLFEGRAIQGAPRMVLQRGEKIIENGQLVARPGRGRFLPTRPAGRERVAGS
jgi:dihydropyrimidinase